MKAATEFKVGLAVVLTVTAIFFGVRFLEDRPLVGQPYEVVALFDNAQGLTAGSLVRMSGVRMGTVGAVTLDPANPRNVLVRILVDPGVTIPTGSTASTSGISSLGPGAVAIEILPGLGARALAAGDTLLEGGHTDPVAALSGRAATSMDQADTLMIALTSTAAGLNTLMNSPESDLRQTLAALSQTLAAVNGLLASEQAGLARTLDALETTATNTATLTAELEAFTAQNSDTLAATVQHLNQTLAQVQTSLRAVDATLAHLSSPDGTAGLLLTDPSLYHNLNAASATLNQLLTDFQNDPKRYLKELRLVDLF